MSQKAVDRPAPTSSTDGRLQQEVLAAVRQNPRVPKDRVSVVVRDGTATLEGTVTWKYESAAAAAAAAGVQGVTEVDNHLTVEIA